MLCHYQFLFHAGVHELIFMHPCYYSFDIIAFCSLIIVIIIILTVERLL